MSCIGKVGLAPFVGDNLGSKVSSPTIVVYADEIIEQARLFARGFILDDAAVALDEVVRTGPGGSFLMSDLTLKLFRTAYYTSDIFPRLTLEEWQTGGSPRAGELLRHYTQDLLYDLRAPEDHAELLARGEEFISSGSFGRGKVAGCRPVA